MSYCRNPIYVFGSITGNLEAYLGNDIMKEFDLEESMRSFTVPYDNYGTAQMTMYGYLSYWKDQGYAVPDSTFRRLLNEIEEGRHQLELDSMSDDD